jgi:hypothetical protein
MTLHKLDQDFRQVKNKYIGFDPEVFILQANALIALHV